MDVRCAALSLSLGAEGPQAVIPKPTVTWVKKVIAHKHGGIGSDCYLRPMDCPNTPVYYTYETIYVPSDAA